MFKLTPTGALTALSLPLLLIPLAGSRSAVEQVQVSGTSTLAYVKQQTADVGDVEGHALMLDQARGSNRNTGRTDYMSDAEVSNVEAADLVQGNGPHHGYLTFSKSGETAIAKWSGNVTTTLSQNKTPMTSFEGKWAFVKGTGQYQGITGSGTYRGRFTAQTEYTVDWKGEYSR